MADIKLFGDTSKGCIFFEGSTVSPKFLGTISAAAHPDLSDRIIVYRTDRFKPGTTDYRKLFRKLKIDRLKNSLDEYLVADLGFDRSQVINYVNTEAQAVGSSTGSSPAITSSTSIPLTTGDSLNYELTADYGVGYEWTNLPSGVVPVEGNVRKLIGGSQLSAGTYTMTAKAVNYFGEDSQNITLTVSNPPYNDTKSIFFQQSEYMGANAALAESTLGRSSNGSGSSDAWTISFWYKGSTDSRGQTIFYFGNNDTQNGGHIEIRQVQTSRLRLRYGTTQNYLQLQTGVGSLPTDWCHIMITYDGGTTGSSSADIDDYYGRFKIYIDGSQAAVVTAHSNYGYTGSVIGQNLRLGRYASGVHMRGSYVNEVSLHDSDQSSNVSTIYNSGAPRDLTGLFDTTHWWRMGDTDTYPNIQDQVDNATMVMYNMTASNIVTDVP